MRASKASVMSSGVETSLDYHLLIYRREMNDEARMTNDEGMTMSKCRICVNARNLRMTYLRDLCALCGKKNSAA